MRTLIILLAFAAPAFAKEIQLSEIHATVPSEGMQAANSTQKVGGKYIHQDGDAIRELQKTYRSGASHVLLARGDNLRDAINATIRAAGLLRADRPVTKPNAETRGNYWLVAYLGLGTFDSLTVKSVTVEENTIRLAYTERQSKNPVLMGYQYFYWIPVGKLDAGDYELELFDSGRKKVTLMRLVEVK